MIATANITIFCQIWESVKCMQFFCDKLDLYNIIYKMQLKSLREAYSSDSSVVSKCCPFFIFKNAVQ